jgi:hypothetical protein
VLPGRPQDCVLVGIGRSIGRSHIAPQWVLGEAQPNVVKGDHRSVGCDEEVHLTRPNVVPIYDSVAANREELVLNGTSWS